MTNDKPVNSLEHLVPATKEDARAIIHKSPNKSCKLDSLPTWLLKDCLDKLLPLITNIVNSSMTADSVSKDFKSARIRSLLKKSGLDQKLLKELQARFKPTLHIEDSREGLRQKSGTPFN